MDRSLEYFLHGGMLVLKEEAPAQEAARAMHERRVGSVLVSSKEGKLVGILTDRDLATEVMAFGYTLETPIRQIMTPDILSITDEQSVEDAINLMTANGIRRVPVIKASSAGREHCIGIVTLDDLIVEKMVSTDVLSRIVSQQVLRRTKGHKKQDRQDARKDQALDRFFKIMEKQMRVSRPEVDNIVSYLLGAVVQRLPATGAAQLISQLPGLLQENLLDLRAGPNREITADVLFKELVSKYGLELKKTADVLEGFWAGLEEFTGGSGETTHVLMQLPIEMRAVFL